MAFPKSNGIDLLNERFEMQIGLFFSVFVNYIFLDFVRFFWAWEIFVLKPKM